MRIKLTNEHQLFDIIICFSFSIVSVVFTYVTTALNLIPGLEKFSNKIGLMNTMKGSYGNSDITSVSITLSLQALLVNLEEGR